MKYLDKEKIIFVDNHILVVNKPAGMTTQDVDGEGEGKSLESLAKTWIKKTYHKPGSVFLHAVHRLDRPVSGLVLFARTSKALSRLQEQMRAKKIIKTYYAEVTGKMPNSKGRLEHFLIHDAFRARIVPQAHPEAKQAILDYCVLKETPHTSLLEIVLVTGRYHQIRAQLSAVGCPIIGDEKYASPKRLPGGIIALHHGKLSFEHPVTKQPLETVCKFNFN